MTHIERMAYQRAYRRKNGNAETRKYERTNPKGFIMRLYRNMWSRVTGIQHKKAHLYLGLEILPKTDFYSWALAAESEFWAMWREWQETGSQRLVPSIDRIDPTRGYTLDNMRWLPQHENSRHTRGQFNGRHH